jgi:hypothetical protein
VADTFLFLDTVAVAATVQFAGLDDPSDELPDTLAEFYATPAPAVDELPSLDLALRGILPERVEQPAGTEARRPTTACAAPAGSPCSRR